MFYKKSYEPLRLVLYRFRHYYFGVDLGELIFNAHYYAITIPDLVDRLVFQCCPDTLGHSPFDCASFLVSSKPITGHKG